MVWNTNDSLTSNAMNNQTVSSLTVEGVFTSSGTILSTGVFSSTGTLSLGTFSELTVSGTISVNTLAEFTAGNGVWADSVRFRDSTVSCSIFWATSGFTGETLIVNSNATVQGTLSANTIGEVTSGYGVSIDGIGLKDGTLSANTIAEVTSGYGVSIDGVGLKDNVVTASAVTASGITASAITVQGTLSTNTIGSFSGNTITLSSGISTPQLWIRDGGSEAVPGVFIGGASAGKIFYNTGANSLLLGAQGEALAAFTNPNGIATQILGDGTLGGAQYKLVSANTGSQSLLFDGSTTTRGEVVFDWDGAVGSRWMFQFNGVTMLSIDTTSTASTTGLWLYDVDSGNLSQVYVGGDDSAGAGYRYLMVPNI